MPEPTLGDAFRFDCAAVIDTSNGRLHEFGPDDVAKLIAFLGKAEELVGINSRNFDQYALERAAGRQAIAHLHATTHLDLSGWRGHFGLRDLTPVFEFCQGSRLFFGGKAPSRTIEICLE
jgi:hypothetical protein